MAHHELPLPSKGSLVYARVTAVGHPGCFYIVMPHGTMDASRAEDDQKRSHQSGGPLDEGEETLESLMEGMNDTYGTSRHQNHKTMVFASELVAARYDRRWFRARVVNTNVPDCASDDADRDGGGGDHLAALLVDFGLLVLVAPTEVRKLLPRFLHLPLQAVECSLSGVEPVSSSAWWSPEAKKK